MAYIPSLLIFLMENADSTRMYVRVYISIKRKKAEGV